MVTSDDAALAFLHSDDACSDSFMGLYVEAEEASTDGSDVNIDGPINLRGMVAAVLAAVDARVVEV